MDPVTEIPRTFPTEEPIRIESPEPTRPETRLTPAQWVRTNLFASPAGSVLTILFGGLILYVTYRLARFALVTSDWEIVRRNLRLFIIGRYPADEAWRLWGGLLIVTAVAGLLNGAAATTTIRQAEAAELEYERPGPLDWIRRYWPALVAVAVILANTRSWGPTLGVLGGAAVLVVSRLVGRYAPPVAQVLAFAGPAAYLAYVWFGPVLGTVLLAVGVAPFVVRQLGGPSPSDLVGRASGPLTVVGAVVLLAVLGAVATVVGPSFAVLLLILVLSGPALTRSMGPALVVAGLAAFALVNEGGIDWDRWGGLHLTVFVTVAGIALSFPLGVLVALGRRSTLPAVRWINVIYIELIRGVPLITLLFMGHYVIPLFFPNTVDPPSPLARALIAITLFEAAYVAETVRGGLQSIPRGQYEAAQAIGLQRWSMTRLIVLPQALRAVIPAMVGQFISLFKDTSLLSIIGFLELIEVAENTVVQPDFLGQRLHTVTFAFVALIFWAGSYTMSRESRRLERRLGIGERR